MDFSACASTSGETYAARGNHIEACHNSGALGATGIGAGRHDGDFESAICLDALRQAVSDGNRGHAAGDSGYLLAAGHLADLSVTVAGLVGGAIRVPVPDHVGLHSDRA